MKLEIGVDIEEISRFEDLKSDFIFLKKVFTQEEIDFCLKKKFPEHHLAARFAAKEATIKAFYALKRKYVNFKDVSVEIDQNVPLLKIVGSENLIARVSLSHERDKAIAFVVLHEQDKISN